MTLFNHPSAPSRALLALVGVTGLVAVVGAASPTFWRVSTQDEFLKGEVEDVSVDAAGQIRLGRQTDVIYETTAPFLWTAARDGEGLWLGSGNDGRVFHVGADGTGAEVFDAGELNVHAVTPLGDGSAYVGTSPDGAVFRVVADDPSSSTPLFDPDERYIWAILQSPRESPFDGDILVATGDPGRIYRVGGNGDATLFYDTKTTHVMALSFDERGNVLAGTGSPGQVFRIAPDGDAFVVLNSSFDEIRTIRMAADGSYYAAAVTQSSSGGNASTDATPSATSSSTSATVVATASASGDSATTTSSSGGSGVSAGAVYHIQADGLWDIAWQSSTDAPYDVALLGDEAAGILIGTGGDGKIFHVVEEPARVVLLARAPAQQVTAFVSAADGATYYATANPGKLFRLSPARASRGTYLSDVHDASAVSTWGTLRWKATTPADSIIQLFTRTGNTDAPNETWSVWNGPYDDPAGSQITSPKARYIQWKAELSGTDDALSLRSVTAAYLPRNLRPQLTTLTVHNPGVVFQQPFSGTDPPIAGLGDGAEARAAAKGGTETQSSMGRRVYRKGLQAFVWTAQDGNEDDLEYDILYRAELDDSWHPLATRLREKVFTWDTTSAPDGTYVVRVVASDAPSNAPGAALSGLRDTTPFSIDNSAPTIRIGDGLTEGDSHLTRFLVADDHSPIRRVEFSFDMERWQVVYPVDGIPDSHIERFELRTSAADSNRLVLRATDTMSNTATASTR